MRPFALLATAFLVLAPVHALADIPPPDSEGCFDLVPGDACKTDDDKDGECVQETCTRSTPNGQQTYDCLICREGGDAGGGCGVTTGRGVRAGGAVAAVLALASLCALGRRRAASGDRSRAKKR